MHLLCVDFSNLVIRHASNPYNGSVDAANRRVGGACGSLAQVLRLIRELSPTHMIIARDGSRSSGFRRQIDPGYKAHREEADDDLLHQFAVAYTGVGILGIPMVGRDTFEADDVIASAAVAFPGHTTIVSGDKDLLALCAEDVTVRLLKPGGHLDCGPDQCREIFGVGPDHVQDYKALVGDPSDGIVGVPGIGPKRALSLLGAYGDVHSILAALDATEVLDGATKSVTEKMREGRHSAETSYRLAGLVSDLELPELLECRAPSIPTDSQIGEKLSEAGLHDLRRNLPGAKREELVDDAPFDFADAFSAALG